jgi:tetratricopeptide (TPR) repeat protein
MFDDAKVQLDAALKLDPEHADSHYLVGVIYLQEGKTIENALTYDRCLQDASAGLQRERARELHGQARTAFTRAAELYREGSAGRGRAQNSLAAISLYFEDHGRAVEEAKGALAAQFYPERFSALANLGWAYYGQGDLVQAMTELRQALLLNEDYCVGHYRLAQVYLDAGMDAEAADEAIKAVANPMCPIQDAFRVAGISHLRLGRTQEGAQALQSCVELAPRSCLASECAALVGHATVAQQP